MGRLFRPRRSVEWLNSFVKVVWPLINPDMFVSIIDMVEDVMQASLPGFVDAVKVSFPSASSLAPVSVSAALLFGLAQVGAARY
jgi:hypothetical protein